MLYADGASSGRWEREIYERILVIDLIERYDEGEACLHKNIYKSSYFIFIPLIELDFRISGVSKLGERFHDDWHRCAVARELLL
jgi:hypothetical protein